MNKKTYIYIFLALLLTYITLAFSLPSDPEVLSKYDITQTDARLLSLTIVIPISAIYLSALYGFIKFKEYTKTIKKTKEGPFFHKISIGLMVLAFALPINSITSSMVNYTKFNSPDLYSSLSVVQNYLTMILALIGVSFVSWGAEGLYRTIQKDKLKTNKLHARLAILGPIILGCMYTLLITSQGGVSEFEDTYNLPTWVVVLTIAVPYVYIWCIGVRAVLHFHGYKLGVKGIIYKNAFSKVSKGFGVIIAVSILIQIITTLSERLNRLNLTPLLLVIYLLVIMYAVGYGLIAVGAKKLNKIEEV